MKKTIIFYSIPAYGHTHSNIYFARYLVEKGFRIIYYSTDLFRETIEVNDCEFRSYPFQQNELDLEDGSRLLKLYRIILDYTQQMLPVLLAEARTEQPCAVMFDSLALWGRAMGQLLQIPCYSFYSIAAIERVGGNGFRNYVSGFTMDFWCYAGEIPAALRCRRFLHKTYGIRHLGILSVLMNKGDKNLMGFSRAFQPDGQGFGPDYLFLGPVTVCRKDLEINDFTCPKGRLIYISLGTITNHNETLFREIVKQFGDTDDQIVMVWDLNKVKESVTLPKNFTVRRFLNQAEILQQASLFITAGGMNSIHQALYYGVPCLLCPQQGEQLLNARQFEKLGFGRILRQPKELRRQAEQAMVLNAVWDENLRERMLTIHLDEVLTLFEGGRVNE